jgi:hypothetical protein
MRFICGRLRLWYGEGFVLFAGGLHSLRSHGEHMVHGVEYRLKYIWDKGGELEASHQTTLSPIKLPPITTAL